VAVDRLKEQELWEDLHPKVKRGLSSLMDNVAFQDGRAFSTETGEEVTHLVDVSLKTTDKQVRGLQGIDYLTEHYNENGKFVFAFFKQLTTMESRFPSLSKQDTARLMFLGTFVEWGSNRLQAPNGRQHYDKKALEKLVEMSTKRFNEFFRKLENEGIIEEKESGEIFMNQSVFYRGKLKDNEYDVSDLDYNKIFRKTVQDLYAEFKGRRLSQLANIYSVLPFLNFNTNIVCHNPEETSETLIKPMTLSELAEILGYSDAHKLKRALETIKVNNNPVFWIPPNVHNKRELRIIVNPRVVFAGNSESLKAVKAMFN